MTPLRAYRKAKGLKLHHVVDAIGVSESQLSRIEREGTPKLDIAMKLSALTGEPAEAFQKLRAAA